MATQQLTGSKMDMEEKKEVDDTTITSKHKQASATRSRGEVNVTINLLRPQFDSIWFDW
jgi:hypothetical protein